MLSTDAIQCMLQRRRLQFQKASRSMPKALRAEAEVLMARLQTSARADRRVVIGQVYLDGGLDEVRRRIAETHLVLHGSPYLTAAGRPELDRRHTKAKQRRVQQKATKEQPSRAAWEAKKSEAMAALARGKPIPTIYRPVRGYDPQSVRLGARQKCLQTATANAI